MPAEKKRGIAGRGRAGERGEKERILSYKWLCEERRAGAFLDKLPLKWRKVFKGRSGVQRGEVSGVSPLFPTERPGRGSQDSAVGDR